MEFQDLKYILNYYGLRWVIDNKYLGPGFRIEVSKGDTFRISPRWKILKDPCDFKFKKLGYGNMIRLDPFSIVLSNTKDLSFDEVILFVCINIK